MNQRGRFPLTALIAGCVAWSATTASGAMLTTVTPVGPDLVWESAGTLDLSAATYGGSEATYGFFVPSAIFALGPDSSAPSPADAFALPNFSGPADIGPGLVPLLATGGTGVHHGLIFVPTDTYTESAIVPSGYVSGDPLVGTSTYTGFVLDPGLTPGSYTWTWDTATGSDSWTLVVVPEPASLALLSVATPLLLRRRAV